MEELNTVNEVQEPVVEAQAPEDVNSEVTEPEEGTPDPEEEGAAAPPPQSPEENSRFAALRRQYEAQLAQQQARRQEESATQQRLMEALYGYGYRGEPEDVADALAAQRANLSVEQLRAQRQEEQTRLRQLMQRDPEYLAVRAQADQFKEMVFESVYEKDVAEINRAFPDAKIKTLDELGDDFAGMRASGIGNLAAYAALRQVREATARPVPPAIGAVNLSANREKDYYSPEEADRLTSGQLDNPKIMQAVMKSMSKWK